MEQRIIGAVLAAVLGLGAVQVQSASAAPASGLTRVGHGTLAPTQVIRGGHVYSAHFSRASSTLSVSSATTAAPAVPLPHATWATVTSDPNQYPVLWVHGLISMLGMCAGINADKQPSALRTMLSGQGYAGQVLGVAYYCGDTGALVIRNAAPTPYNSQYGNDAPIERLGLDLAWAVYNNYTSIGQYVYLAGHSIGGLIIRDALSKSGTVDGYPPVPLLVAADLTFSTPYNGTDRAPNTAAWCGSSVQCQEITPGSPFVLDQQLRMIPSTVDVTTIGGGPADNVDSFSSSSAVNAQHKINYYAAAPVDYNHNTYFQDLSAATDEPFAITNSTTGRPVTWYFVSVHATRMGAIAILKPNW